MKDLIKKNKLKIDYKYVRNILENNTQAIINCEYILMDIKPYRRSIFLQIYGKKNDKEKIWRNKQAHDKLLWIETVLLNKFEKEEFVEHILKAISMFRDKQKVVKSFLLALEYDLQEEIKNV